MLLHKGGILPKAFQDLWSNDRLLNVVEQMIGPDVAGSPVWNLRTKTPNNPSVTVPWHQGKSLSNPPPARLWHQSSEQQTMQGPLESLAESLIALMVETGIYSHL